MITSKIIAKPQKIRRHQQQSHNEASLVFHKRTTTLTLLSKNNDSNSAHFKTMAARQALMLGSGAVGLGTSAYIFHTLTDFSQAIIQRTDRNDFMSSYHNRHKLAAVGMGGIVTNSLLYWTQKKPRKPHAAVWAGFNAVALGLWYGGYLNPEIVSRESKRTSDNSFTIDSSHPFHINRCFVPATTTPCLLPPAKPPRS